MKIEIEEALEALKDVIPKDQLQVVRLRLSKIATASKEEKANDRVPPTKYEPVVLMVEGAEKLSDTPTYIVEYAPDKLDHDRVIPTLLAATAASNSTGGNPIDTINGIIESLPKSFLKDSGIRIKRRSIVIPITVPDNRLSDTITNPD